MKRASLRRLTGVWVMLAWGRVPPVRRGLGAQFPPSSPPSWMDASVKQGQGRKHQQEQALQGGCQFNDAAQPIVTSDLKRATYELDSGTKISLRWGVEGVIYPIPWT